MQVVRRTRRLWCQRSIFYDLVDFRMAQCCRAVHGSAAQCSTVRCVMHLCCCSVVGVTSGLAVVAGAQVAFRVPGVCLAPPLWLWTQCSCCFFPWCQGVVSCFHLVALRAVGCRVCCFVRFRRLRARWVFLVVAGCFGPCSCAPALVLLARAHGPALRLGVCLSEFPAVVCSVTPVPPIASLCNTQSGDRQLLTRYPVETVLNL